MTRVIRGGVGAMLLMALVQLPVASASGVDLYGAFFKTGHPLKGESLAQSVGDPEQQENLDASIATLKRVPELTFEVAGYTDQYECSSNDECASLALRRALLVYRYLLDSGIDAHRVIKLCEYGSSRPIARRQEDFAMNQRAELNIMVDP